MPTANQSANVPGSKTGRGMPPRSRAELYARKAIEVMTLAGAVKEPVARRDLLDLHARYSRLAKLAI
jgi:hypothetical protein